jgi:hypothetical protein
LASCNRCGNLGPRLLPEFAVASKRCSTQPKRVDSVQARTRRDGKDILINGDHVFQRIAIRLRCILVQRKVCSRAIVILHIQKEHVRRCRSPKTMTWSSHSPPERANQPFRMSILPWASVVQLAGRECPWREAAGENFHRPSRNRGRCTSAFVPSRPGNPLAVGCAVTPSRRIWRRPLLRTSKP